jgi:transglutaminase-like putative cysteine protease
MSESAGAAALRIAAFAALAAFVAVHWTRLVVDPPLARALLCVLTLAAGAGTLVLAGRARLPRLPRSALAALAATVTVIAALLVVGMPARFLAPANWDELGSAIHSGLEGIEDVNYPYAGDHPWSRLVILLVLPVTLGAAAALAFWPAGKRAMLLRTLALVIVVGLYANAVTTNSVAQPLLHGLALLALIAAWLWLPGVGRGGLLASGALVAASAAIAVPVAAALDAEDPWLDHSDWSIDVSGRGGSESFDWDHSYGPLDWPRTGKKLVEVRSESPHYWRAAILDSFDGVRWRSSPVDGEPPLELPGQVAETGAAWNRLNERWIDWSRFDVVALSSRVVLSPGAVEAVRGLDVTMDSGQLTSSDGALEEGDSYALRAYAPEPSPERMQRAGDRYPAALGAFTTLLLPAAGEPEAAGASDSSFTVPLWQDGLAPVAFRPLVESAYAPVYALARTWSADAATPYEAAAAIEERLKADYQYSEESPRHRYPLRAFLLADRFGYCQQFSGAMALMLRMIGIPSRVAAGFSPGERDGDRFVVHDYDAHSWVEVYFNGIGWVPFDPTPGIAPARSQSVGAPERPGPLPGAASPGPTQDSRSRPAGVPRQGDGSGASALWFVGGGIGVALLAAAAPFALRRRRYLSLGDAELVQAQLAELEAAMRRLSQPIGAGTTLRELERRLGNRGRRSAAAYAAKLRAARYRQGGSRPPNLAERRRLRRELGSGRGAGARLRSLLAIPPGGPALPIR